MKLEHILINKTNDRETVNIETTQEYITVNGDGWSMTFTQKGLATQCVIHTPEGDNTLNLKAPTYREVRNKVRESGRAVLNNTEKTILDSQGGRV
jgi:hypothetical protein